MVSAGLLGFLLMSDDDWREERLRARRQREAEEAAAEEAAAAARGAAAPPSASPEQRPAIRPPRPRPPSPAFGRTRTTGQGSRLPSFKLALPPLNALQLSLIALGLVLAVSGLAIGLKPRHPNGADAAPSGAQQQAAAAQPDEAVDGGSAPPPTALRPSLPISASPMAVIGPQGDAPAPAVAPEAPPVTTPARWIEKPSDNEIAAAFPDEAKASDAAGRVMIQCVISAAGEPSGCTVQSESPTGDGFGHAALGLARKFTFKPKTVNGVAVDGGVATVSIRFTR